MLLLYRYMGEILAGLTELCASVGTLLAFNCPKKRFPGLATAKVKEHF